MKCLRANNPGERDRYYDKAALARLDQEQGRVRINSAEHQSMLYLITGRWLIEEGFAALKPFLRAAGGYRRIASALPMIANAIQKCTDHICSDQLISMAAAQCPYVGLEVEDEDGEL